MKYKKKISYNLDLVDYVVSYRLCFNDKISFNVMTTHNLETEAMGHMFRNAKRDIVNDWKWMYRNVVDNNAESWAGREL